MNNTLCLCQGRDARISLAYYRVSRDLTFRSQGMTPLHWASDHGSVACAQALLRAGAKANVQVSAKHMTRSRNLGAA
jgi:ankyrin repeat protein